MRASRSNAVPAARTVTAVATLAPWSNAMRAPMWFVAKQTDASNTIATPRRAGSFSSMATAAPEAALQHALGFDEAHDVGEPLSRLEVREHERPLAAHPARVAVHDLERRPDHRREVDLVDHQQVALGDARAAFARDLVARRDVDHVQGQVGELRAEGRGEVVAAGLDEDQVEPGKAAIQARHRLQVDRGVLA